MTVDVAVERKPREVVVLERHAAIAEALDDGVEVTGPVWVGPDADVAAGARIGESVIGAGAHVPADAVLSKVVVWDGATVPSGTLERAIVLSDGRVIHA